MSKLVDMALGQRIEPPSSDLNAEPLDSLDVDKGPPLNVKLENAQHHAQFLATFLFMDNQSKFTPTNVMKLLAI